MKPGLRAGLELVIKESMFICSFHSPPKPKTKQPPQIQVMLQLQVHHAGSSWKQAGFVRWGWGWLWGSYVLAMFQEKGCSCKSKRKRKGKKRNKKKKEKRKKMSFNYFEHFWACNYKPVLFQRRFKMQFKALHAFLIGNLVMLGFCGLTDCLAFLPVLRD